MVELFDGVTELEFELDSEGDWDSDENGPYPYEYRWDRWSFAKHWFCPPEPNWLAEEDFVL